MPATSRLKYFLPSLIVAVVGTALLFRSLLVTTSFPVMWANDFDPRLIAWGVEWGYQKIFVRCQPFSVFQANIFFPHSYTLAYSDSLLSLQFFYAPLRILGFGVWSALYGTLIISTLVGCLLTARAASRLWQLTALELAIIVFCAHFSLPFITTLTHYQLFGFHFAPALVITAWRLLERSETKDLIEACLLFSFGTGFAMYLAPMSVAVIILTMTIGCIHSVRVRHNIWKIAKRAETWVILGAMVSILYLTQLRPYYLVEQQFPPQSFAETWTYSARPWSLLRLHSVHSYWYGSGGYGENGDWERAIFPGYLLLVSAGIAAITALVQMRKRLSNYTSIFTDHKLAALSIITLLACLMLSMGPYLDVAGTTKLPYYYLAKILPGLQSLRAPGRFGMLMGLPFGLAAVVTLRALHSPRIGATLSQVIALAVVMIESFPLFATHELTLKHLEPIHQALKAEIQIGTPIVELPSADGDRFGTLKRIMAQMNGANIHGGNLVVGYAAKSTHESDEIVALDGLVQNGGAAPEQLIKFISSIPVSHVLVDRTTYRKTALSALETALRAQSERQVELLQGAAALYVLRASEANS